MSEWIRRANYSDLATIGTAFSYASTPIVSDWIIPGTTGDIVWINNQGLPQYLKAAQANQLYYLQATKIVSTATVNGNVRSTTATNIQWGAINFLANNPA